MGDDRFGCVPRVRIPAEVLSDVASPAAARLEREVRNPWLKKNPFMSMWLSGANAMLGSARSRASARGKQQAAALVATGTRQAIRFWTGGLPPARSRRTRKSS